MIGIKKDKCDFCGTCVGVCPVDCIELSISHIEIVHKICIDCDLCIKICPIEVLYKAEQKKGN